MTQRNTRKPDRASWRKSKARAASQPTITGFGASGQSRRNYLFKRALLSFVTILLVIVFFRWLLKVPDREVPLIVAAVTKSSNRIEKDPLLIPPNPYAFEDVELWKRWFDDQQTDQNVAFKEKVDEQIGPLEITQSRDKSYDYELISQLKRQINNATPGGVDGQMIAISVIAQGLVDDEQPFLLVGNSRPDDPDSWVPVKTMLTQINDLLTEKDCRCVLFLDANRAGAIWDWGKLDQSFADECSKVAEATQDRLAVIVSCGANERSWWDPGKGRGLFAWAIIQAMTGHLDSDFDIDENDDGTITIGEMASFLGNQVAKDAQATWGASQRPQLLTSAASSWKFMRTPDWRGAPAGSDAPLAERIDQIKKQFASIDQLWQDHNEVAKRHSPLTSSPLEWAILEKRLARLDQLALAGREYETELKDLIKNCGDLLARMRRVTGDLIPSEALPELGLVEYFHGPYEPPAVEQEFVDAWVKKPVADAMIPPELQNDTEIKLTRMLWPWLVGEKKFDQETLKIANGLLETGGVGANSRLPARLLETHLIRLFSAPDLNRMSDDRINAIIGAHRASRAALLQPDLRALFWLRGRALKLDEQRLEWGDQLFADAGPSDTVERLTQLSKEYETLGASGKMISDAYRLRDQMLHEIPRIAETLLADSGAFENEELGGATAQLIQKGTVRLGCLTESLRLTDAGDEPLAQMDKLARQFDDAQQVMDELQSRLNSRAQQVVNRKAADGRGLRQAVAMLNGSGVNGADARKKIHVRLIELLPKLTAEALASKDGMDALSTDNLAVETSQQADVAVRSALIGGLHAWTYWLEQTKQFSCAADQPASDLPLTKQGGTLRQTLGSLLADEFAQARLEPAKHTVAGKPLATVRQEVADLDNRLRSQTFLLSGRRDEIAKALNDRFALDLRLFALDHAERTMREFWCEARAGESPYFAQATDQLLSINPAESPLGPLEGQSKLDGVDLSARLASYKKASNDPATLSAIPGEKWDNPSTLESVQGKQVDFYVQHPDGLPVGSVTLATEKTVGSTRQTVLVSTGASPTDSVPFASIKVPSDLTDADRMFAVNSFFRGLRRRGGLSIRPLGDPSSVVFELAEYTAPTAVVRRDAREPERIVLVLDCSDSMNAGARLMSAKTAVKDFLKELTKDSSVGLVLFGHRYGWQTKPGEKVKRKLIGVGQGKYKTFAIRNDQWQELSPLRVDERQIHNSNFDVSVEVELGALNAKGQLDELLDSIDALRAVGQTPTYQAIVEAFKVLGRNSGHVIVITDGVPDLAGIPQSPYRETAKQLFKAGPGLLHIISYAFNKALLTDLEADFPGRISEAKDGEALLEMLRDAMPSATVQWRGNAGSASDVANFDEPVTINPWPPKSLPILSGQPARPAQPYTIRASVGGSSAEANVFVEGNEEFVLKLDGNRLIHDPFPRQDQVCQDLTMTPGKDRDSLFALPPEVSKNQGLTLQLVIENRDKEKFTPRPTDVWIDLVALDDANSRRKAYSISLADFAKSRPVPVLVCRVDDWPTWADNAAVEVWLGFGDPEADREPLSLKNGRSFAIDKIDGVEFLVEQTKGDAPQWVITEKHRQGQDTRRLRVLPDPLPQRSLTRYYDDVVKRTFQYDELPSNLQMFVTEKEQITTDATIHAKGRIKISR